MIYLASPYSDSDPEVREQRFEKVCQAAAGLVRAGHIVFSPIAHGHSISKFGLPTGWKDWEKSDRAFLVRCDEVAVLTLDGWDESEGVREEIRIAKEIEKPVQYVSPSNLEFTEIP